MQKLPSVRQLQYFVNLEELGHFGRAAEACFVSQSAFSTAIRELESTLGVQLVDRTNRRVVVNTVGREVAAQARILPARYAGYRSPRPRGRYAAGGQAGARSDTYYRSLPVATADEEAAPHLS